MSDLLLDYQEWLRIGGAGFLLWSGSGHLRAEPLAGTQSERDPETLLADFASTFALTLTNPITILAFLAIFAGIGFTGEDATMGGAAILVLGVWLGSLLWWAGLALGAGHVRHSFRRNHLVWINRGSGGILLLSGAGCSAACWCSISAELAREGGEIIGLSAACLHRDQRGADRAYRAPRFRAAGEPRRRAAAAELIASQIPFLVERRGDGCCCRAISRAPIRRLPISTDGAEVLAIFPGPHAYISPGWYEAGPAVPTWNYASVHAYGTARAIRDPEWLRDMLDRLSARHEAREAAPWRMRDLPQAYLESMLRGIVGIEIAVSRLEGKFKLSQNRPASDRPRIIAALERRDEETRARWRR